MIMHKQSRIIQLSAQQLYNVVKDVQLYPKFLPWCSGAKVFTTRNPLQFDAELEIDFKIYKAAYMSRVQLIQTHNCYKVISDSNENQVFRRLHSIWELNNINNGGNQCEAKYSIEFEFKNMIYQHMSQLFMNEVVHKMTEAFENRALSLYPQQQINDEQVDILEILHAKQLITEQQRQQLNRNIHIKTVLSQYYKLQGDEKCREFLNQYLLQL